MKKIVIASIMAFAATAFAGTATVEYQTADGVYGGPGSTATTLVVAEKVGHGVVADFGITNAVTSGTKALGTQVELGGAYAQPVGPVTASVRVATGNGYVSGASAAYWSVEPAVAYAVNDKFTVKLGYRYHTAFNSDIADQTRTTRLGGSYAFTKNDTVGIRLDNTRGDTQTNALAVNYTRSF